MDWQNRSAPIALVGPLSGPRSAHAPLLAHAAKHLDHLGFPYLLLDDGAEPEVALNVAQQLAKRAVSAVIGHFNSACAEVALPVYRENGVVLMLPASSQDGLTTYGGAYRLCARDSQQAALMLRFVARQAIANEEMEVVADGSAYSRRMVNALYAALNDEEIPIVKGDQLPGATCRLRLVLATCQGALNISQHIRDWPGVSLYSDDAHVKTFARQAMPSKTFVIGPEPDYEHLIVRACNLIGDARADNATSLDKWLTASGYFDVSGNAKDAEWRIHALQENATWNQISE